MSSKDDEIEEMQEDLEPEITPGGEEKEGSSKPQMEDEEQGSDKKESRTTPPSGTELLAMGTRVRTADRNKEMRDGLVVGFSKNTDTYDISFEAGGEMLRVPREKLEVLEQSQQSADVSAPAADPDPNHTIVRGKEWQPLYKKGQMVEALRGDSGWCMAVVATVYLHKRSYDVIFSDRKKESWVREESLRASMDDKEQIQPSAEEQEWEQSKPIEEGTLVEARYEERGRKEGIVPRKRVDGFYDVDYDDGEREAKVQPGNVRVRGDSSRHVAAPMECGATVVCNCHGEGVWFPATITQAREDGTYDIDYDDGEYEYGVHAPFVRVLCRPLTTDVLIETGLDLGVLVVGNYHQKGAWYEGFISRVNGDDTYAIDYEDGGKESAVSWDHLRRIGPAESEDVDDDASAASTEALADEKDTSSASEGTRKPFAMGDKVEANYRAKGRWLQGVVAGGNADGTYEIKYDDGEVEKNVRGLSMRLIDVANAVDGSMKAGARVEANFRNRGRWLPGCVKKVNRDGTCNVDYDYGEMEARVKADCIRVTPTQKAIPITPNGEAADAKTLATFVVGSEVEANYGGEGRWLPGRVVRIRPSGTCDIHFDTGDFESFVVPEDVRKASPAEAVITPSKPITRPLAQSKSDSKAVKGGRTYRVAGQSPSPIQIKDSEGSDDLDLGLGVVSCMKGTSPKARASKKQETAAFVVGAAVEGNYRKKGFWFPGKIKRDRGYGYDITYDDGEFETRVTAEFVRAAREVVAIVKFSDNRYTSASRGSENGEVQEQEQELEQGQGQGQGSMSPKGNGKKYKTGMLQAIQRPGESKSSKDSNGSMVISKSELTVLKQLLSAKEQQIQQALKSAAGSSAKSQGSMVISKAELTVLKQLLATKDQEIQTLKTVDQSQGRDGSMNISKAELTVLKQLLATKDQEIQALKTEAGSVQSKGSDGSMNISKAELALLKNLLATKEQQIQALKTAASDSIFRSPIRPPRSPGGSVARDDRAQSQGSDGSMVISKAELTVLKQLLATKNEEIQALRAGAYDDSPPSSAQSNGRGPWSPRQDMEDAFAAADVREMIAANAELTKQFVNMTGNMRVMAQELAQAQANETKTAKRIRGLIAHVAELRRRAAFN